MGPPEAGKSDAELVRAALAGAREPAGELLARHWATAVGLAARVLGSRDLARDAAQEAAIAAITDLARLRSPQRFGAWFCGIALNVARQWVRQLRAEAVWPSADLPSADPGPAEAAEAADLCARVRAAVAGLPDGQRDAVWLFYLQGLSHREVAAELDVSVGAVKSRLHKARAALAPALAGAPRAPAPAGPPRPREGAQMTTTDARHWPEVEVTEIRRGPGADTWQRRHIMILRERGGDRTLPIWIGPAEATAMALALESAESPRPFTTRLAVSLVEAAGGRITDIRITRLSDDGIFYAVVRVDGPAGPQEVDARPSDAVNLALAAGRPVHIEAALLEVTTPAPHDQEVASFPVATAEIAAEAVAARPAPLGTEGSAPD